MSSTNFIRTAKWCADGSSFLAQCEDHTFQTFSFNSHAPSNDNSLTHASTFPQPSPIVDFTWFPGASSQYPPLYCFVASVRECPVKLLDASTGRLRASYKIIDHRERFIAPHSMVFNMHANKLYCGFESAYEVFDVHHPGEGDRVKTSPERKSRDGMKGIVSALAFAPTYDGLFAAGTLSPSTPFTPNIAIYSEETLEPVMYLGADEGGGVTQLVFNPLKPHLLYATMRGQRAVHMWDLRMTGIAGGGAPLRVYEHRPHAGQDQGSDDETMRASTNQKIRFDVDPGGRWLAYGAEDGSMSLFDLHEGDATAAREGEEGNDQEPQVVHPALSFGAHQDVACSTSFHPSHPFLLSASGSRHWGISQGQDADTLSSSSDDDEEDDSELRGTPDVSKQGSRQQPKLYAGKPVPRDSSVKMWYLGGAAS
ncbi:WD40 repeat-like protein [Coniophora puteana RWD-64-598 SS2]|uniref:WD40 repeat-like protein n=1 Tax=Coniophora puteana (strain RWD-64-598) TaxID=741705 RepID=A0A5M3MEH0_CONPW|nr:WD40 repeat-like protein [Coniophora puteana RWD-64-598 SS2]EIW76971.1 WD40 repeat-like protein [Coniophora puteana RWD-64-598 SS2]